MSKKTITETTEKRKPKYTKEAFFEKYRPLLVTHRQAKQPLFLYYLFLFV